MNRNEVLGERRTLVKADAWLISKQKCLQTYTHQIVLMGMRCLMMMMVTVFVILCHADFYESLKET